MTDTAPMGPIAELTAHRIHVMIEEGRLHVGGRLPSERELSEMLGVSRSSVRAALAGMEADGRVRRQRGRAGGTFATEPNPRWPSYARGYRRSGESRKLERRPGADVGVPTLLREQGFEAGTHVIAAGIHPATEQVAEQLELPPGSPVIFVDRVRLADFEPLSWEHAYFPAERFPDMLQHALAGSLYELLQQVYRVELVHISERIEVVLAQHENGRMLDVAVGQPLLSVSRRAADPDGVPVEFSHDLFRADRTTLFIDSQRSPDRPHSPSTTSRFA